MSSSGDPVPPSTGDKEDSQGEVQEAPHFFLTIINMRDIITRRRMGVASCVFW